jgi:hypothetical protein
MNLLYPRGQMFAGLGDPIEGFLDASLRWHDT